MTEATGLKIIASRSPHTKYHENLPSGSNVISRGQTDRQTGDLMNPLSFLESVLKIKFGTLKDHGHTYRFYMNHYAV
jgi:hypothetical protein